MHYEPDFIISKRNNLLTVISLCHHQFCAPVFQPMLQYPWKKGGYIDASAPFETPVQVCFPKGISKSSCKHPLCPKYAFIRCANCSDEFCFHHYVVSYHFC